MMTILIFLSWGKFFGSSGSLKEKTTSSIFCFSCSFTRSGCLPSSSRVASPAIVSSSILQGHLKRTCNSKTSRERQCFTHGRLFGNLYSIRNQRNLRIELSGVSQQLLLEVRALGHRTACSPRQEPAISCPLFTVYTLGIFVFPSNARHKMFCRRL